MKRSSKQRLRTITILDALGLGGPWPWADPAWIEGVSTVQILFDAPPTEVHVISAGHVRVVSVVPCSLDGCDHPMHLKRPIHVLAQAVVDVSDPVTVDFAGSDELDQEHWDLMRRIIGSITNVDHLPRKPPHSSRMGATS